MKTTVKHLETMENQLVCQLCLAKEDLIRITSEKYRLITSLLNLKLPEAANSRICINCTSALTCFDKLHKNSNVAQKILAQTGTHLQRNAFLNVLNKTDGTLSVAFETVLSWLTDVNVILRHCPDEMDVVNASHSQNRSSQVENHEEFDIHFEDVSRLQDVELLCESTKNTDLIDDVKIETQNDETFETSFEDLEEPVEIREESQVQKTPEIEERALDDVPVSKDEDSAFVQDQKNPQEIEDDFNPEDYFDKGRKGKRRPYKCEECGVHFDRMELIYHRNTHLGI